MNESYPQWIQTQNDTMLNLQHVHAFYTKEGVNEGGSYFGIYAEMSTEVVEVAIFLDYDMCEVVYKKLMDTLPIAIISVDLDIFAPLEKETRK